MRCAATSCLDIPRIRKSTPPFFKQDPRSFYRSLEYSNLGRQISKLLRKSKKWYVRLPESPGWPSCKKFKLDTIKIRSTMSFFFPLSILFWEVIHFANRRGYVTKTSRWPRNLWAWQILWFIFTCRLLRCLLKGCAGCLTLKSFLIPTDSLQKYGSSDQEAGSSSCRCGSW